MFVSSAIMSVCVGASGPLGLGSSSRMSLPHHHHHLQMPGLVEGSGGISGLLAHHSPAGHFSNGPSEHSLQPSSSLLSHHLAMPPNQPLATTPGGGAATALLGTMDSQPTIPASNSTVLPKVDDQYPNPDILMALIARNKALEGEWSSN